MELTENQNRVLEKISRFEFERPFFLGGYAGTGKTTLLRALDQAHPGKILFLAPTGKACQVLKTKLSFGADIRTVHSFLYCPVEVSDETLQRWRDEAGEGNEFAKAKLRSYDNGMTVEFMDSCGGAGDDYELVVVDEASMLGMREYLKLVANCPKLVLVGDPFQLPPVQSASVFPEKFDAFLEEVHRAALESPITRLSMDIRSGDFKGWSYWKQNGIEHSVKTTLGVLRSVDQVITGTNAERRRLNRVMRLPCKSWEPRIGDKVIVKENVYAAKGRLRLVNGDIGVLDYIFEESGVLSIKGIPGHEFSEHLRYTDKLIAEGYDDQGRIPYSNVPPERNYKVDYAYAITCHASQGSEWPSVLVYDDKMNTSDKETRLRWLYTAVTRAKERLVFVEKYR